MDYWKNIIGGNDEIGKLDIYLGGGIFAYKQAKNSHPINIKKKRGGLYDDSEPESDPDIDNDEKITLGADDINDINEIIENQETINKLEEQDELNNIDENDKIKQPVEIEPYRSEEVFDIYEKEEKLEIIDKDNIKDLSNETINISGQAIINDGDKEKEFDKDNEGGNELYEE